MTIDTDSTIISRVALELTTLRNQQATGQLVISQINQPSFDWQLYLYLGRLVYATGGLHRVRRWYRIIRQHCPHLLQDKSYTIDHSNDSPWESQILGFWIYQGKISAAQARAIIQSSVREVFFAFIDQEQLQTKWQPRKQLHQQVAFLSIEQTLQEAYQLRDQWRSAGLGHLQQLLGQFSPELAPLVRDPEQLQQQVSTDIYQSLKLLLNGQNTLWDVSSRLQMPLPGITRMLLPLLHQGAIELKEVADLTAPIPQLSPHLGSTTMSPNPSSQPNLSAKFAKLAPNSKSPKAKEELGSTAKPLLELNDSPQLTTGTKSNLAPNNRVTRKKIEDPLEIFDLNEAYPSVTKADHLLIACIDDSPSVGLQMREILEAGGYEVLHILDPLKGMPTLVERKPDLIFLDVEIPSSNGYEICTLLRKTEVFRDTPIIMMDNHESVIDLMKAKMSGASTLLSKPPAAGKVLLTVQKYLSKVEEDSSSENFATQSQLSISANSA